MFAASGMISFAVEHGYLDQNVVKNARKLKAEKNPPRYLSLEEWGAVQEIARETCLWPLVATACYAGFRNSEPRFLTWPEIDFGRNQITTVKEEGFGLKNRESRTVPPNAGLKNILLSSGRKAAAASVK